MFRLYVFRLILYWGDTLVFAKEISKEKKRSICLYRLLVNFESPSGRNRPPLISYKLGYFDKILIAKKDFEYSLFSTITNDYQLESKAANIFQRFYSISATAIITIANYFVFRYLLDLVMSFLTQKIVFLKIKRVFGVILQYL